VGFESIFFFVFSGEDNLQYDIIVGVESTSTPKRFLDILMDKIFTLHLPLSKRKLKYLCRSYIVTSMSNNERKGSL
jgi:hypothetical protein